MRRKQRQPSPRTLSVIRQLNRIPAHDLKFIRGQPVRILIFGRFRSMEAATRSPAQRLANRLAHQVDGRIAAREQFELPSGLANEHVQTA